MGTRNTKHEPQFSAIETHTFLKVFPTQNPVLHLIMTTLCSEAGSWLSQPRNIFRIVLFVATVTFVVCGYATHAPGFILANFGCVVTGIATEGIFTIDKSE